MKFSIILAFLSLSSSLAATEITFWHSMAGGEKTVNALAEGFNSSQKDYVVKPILVGKYPEANTKLAAAWRANNAPVIFQSEISFFPKLVEDGWAADMSSFFKALLSDYTNDFYTSSWNYGLVDNKRYGMPFNTSTPVLYYNRDLFKKFNLKAPTTWEEFANVSKALSNNATKGSLIVPESWSFEQMVLSRGGSLFSGNKPTLNSPQAIEALTFLQNLVKNDQAMVRSLGEAQFAMLDFLRGKAAMVIASTANIPDIPNGALMFDLGVAPLPKGTISRVPLGGAELVVMNSATNSEKSGAFAFWQYLMKPENVVTWVKNTYYLPVRRSALPLLNDWYKADLDRKAAFEQLDEAVARSKSPDFINWRTYLEEALEKALKGGVSAKTALDEAQNKAMK